ncbi:hypothetical protein BZG73_15075 [Salinivibrio siamensis]|uniref:Uncharacterized protein n=1 Tax=Salinivibrio siamensis TaxID=414286 RepID=A0ABX3K576_9GAMM|nr:hypothetical protein BZG73_15075 [Salinivibrio siamensis]
MHYAAWAPVTIGANFNTGAKFDLNVRWRRATGARRKSPQACAIEKALIPTYAYFNIGGAIGDYSFPRSCVGMHTEFEP